MRKYSSLITRNKQPILDVLRTYLPTSCSPFRALEIASGTGQHVAHFAAAFPHITWQPTEAAPNMLESISAYTVDMVNVEAPVLLDVTASPWPVQGPPYNSVHATNITHITPWPVTQALLAGTAKCLCPAGYLFLYGPFAVDGKPHTPGNLRFHQQLVATDPALGYRDIDAVVEEAKAVGLNLHTKLPMPADNYMLVFQKTSLPTLPV